MADRFRDLEILIGARADLQAYQEVEDTLADLDLLAEEISRNLDEANNRELRSISRRVKAYKRLESAYEQGEATVHDLRRAHDQLADSMDKLNEKANNVRGGRAEEDLRAFERQTVAQKRAQEQQLNSNLDASLREQREHVDKLSRIDKEHERQRHQINSTAERAKSAAAGDKQAQMEIDRLRDGELQTVKKQYDLQQKATKEALRRARISVTSRVKQLKEVGQEAGLKAQQKVDKERERNMRMIRRTEEDVANMRLRNERTIATLRERSADREKRQARLGADAGVFKRVRNVAGGLIGVHVLSETINLMRTTVSELVNAQQEVANLHRAFIQLNKGSLIESNKLLAKLDLALLFSTKRIDLLRIGNLALNSGVESLNHRLPGLVANIRTVSLALGRNMVEDVERVVKAMAKMETELLDELGIATRATEAYEDYARALGRTARSLTAVERLEAFAIATSKELQDKADRLTSVIHLQQQAVGELQAGWEQVTLAVGEFASGVFLNILDDMRGIVTEIRLLVSEASEIAQFSGSPEFAAFAKGLEADEFMRLIKHQAQSRVGGSSAPVPQDFSTPDRHGAGFDVEKFNLAFRVFETLSNTIDAKIGEVDQKDINREFIADLFTTLDAVQNNIALSIKGITAEQAKVIAVAAEQFSDSIKGLEIVRIANQAEINKIKKPDTEAALTKLLTEFKERQAALLFGVDERSQRLNKEEVTGELKFNLAEHTGNLVADRGELNALKELATEIGKLSPAEQIPRLKQLRSLQDKLAGTQRKIIKQLLNANLDQFDATTVDGLNKTVDAIKRLTINTADLQKVAKQTDLPIGRLKETFRALGEDAKISFRSARDSERDLLKEKRPTVEINELTDRARETKGQKGANLIYQAVQQLQAHQARVISLMELQFGELATVKDPEGAGIVADELRAFLVEGAAEEKALLDVARELLTVTKKKSPDDKDGVDKITREIRKGSGEFLKAIQGASEQVFGQDNEIINLIKSLTGSSVVKQGFSNLQASKALSAGVSELSVAALGINAAVSLFGGVVQRAEEQGRKEAAERLKDRQDNTALKSDIQNLFSGFEGFDRRLQSNLQPLIQELESSLKGATTPDALIDIIRDAISAADPDTTVAQRIYDLLKEREGPNVGPDGMPRRTASEINAELAPLQAIQALLPDDITFRQLQIEVVKLSDAFRHLIESTSSVTDAQKQEVRDKFNVEREAVRSRFSQNFSNDPYEQSRQLESLRSQLSAISGSEQAALGALDSGSGYNFPSDFSTILTKFTDSLSAIGGANPAGKISVSPDIDSNVTSDQVLGMQEWLDELFTLLDISDDSGIKDKVVAYLASLPDELKFNPSAQVVLEIANIVGINEHTLYTTGLFTTITAFLHTIPEEVVKYLGVVKELPIDALVGISDVEGTLQYVLTTLLSTIASGSVEDILAQEGLILALKDLLDVYDTENIFLQQTKALLITVIDTVIAEAHAEQIEDKPIIPAADIVEVIDVDVALQTQIAFVVHRAIDTAVLDTHYEWGHNQYNLPAGDLVNPVPGRLPGEVATVLDAAVRSGIDIYTAPTYYRYVVDIGPFVNIRASGIESRVSAAIASGVSRGIANYERQSLSQQYSQESSSPVDRYTPRNGF